MQFHARRRAYQAAYPDADDRVIVQAGQAVGRILVLRTDDHIRLVDIAVLPGYRKAGIGTCLIGELIAESKVLPAATAAPGCHRQSRRRPV